MTFTADGAAWFVSETSLRALAAAAAVGVVLRVLRIRAAAVRHSAWSTVLIAMVLMPVLPSLVPELSIPAPARAAGLLRVASITASPAHNVARYSRPATDAAPITVSPTGTSRAMPQTLPPSGAGAPASRAWLPRLFLSVYAAGFAMGLARLCYGWQLVSAMVGRARRHGRIHVGVPGLVYESSEVTVPMTVGAIRPVIILPSTWATWEADTLAAVLAHEMAHVRRHDTAFSFIARVNRAMFWFHPLAWWLERTVTVTAEHACDDAAARAIAAPRRYAEILVEMASIVRRNHGRLTWQAVGVDGAGVLEGRIDRLLRGDAFASTSRGKQIAAAIGCVIVIATVAACRQQAVATPLREDQELAKRLAERVVQTKAFEAARDMTPEQADALEQRIALNPRDFHTRRQLVTYYRTSGSVAWDKKVRGLRRHALWLIEHDPENDVQAPALSPQYDPEGFTAAKQLWEAHLGRPAVSPFLVSRAVQFFAPYDKGYAEQLIRRGMAMDPDSKALAARMPPDVGAYQWPVQLASLYAAALLGSESVWGTYNDLRTHPDRVNAPYAMQVRRTLEVSQDAPLLSLVGGFLTRPTSSSRDPAIQQAREQAQALGVQYLQRALDIDPNLESAKATLVRRKLSQSATDADRLARRAHDGYMVAEDITEYAKKDVAAGQQQRNEAKAHAEQVLTIAAAHRQDPAYSAAIMTAHHVLAIAALREGNREGAVTHLRDSVNVPASDELQYAPPSSWLRPVHRLLKEGERERVAEFLEAFARLTITGRDRLLKDAQAIREGRMPSAYQQTAAREGQ